MRRRPLFLALAAGSLPRPVRGQGMMDKVDLGSPRMTQAELDRSAVQRLIAEAAGRPVGLADRSLDRLDLSGLDLAGADLRWARLDGASLAGARLAGANLALAWAIGADFGEANLPEADLFQAPLGRARFDRADLSRARLVADCDGTSLV